MNSRVKSLLGPAYPFYIRVKTSETVRDLTASIGLPAYRRRRRANPGVLAVNVDARMGLGATIAKALLFHALAEDLELRPEIISSNPLYASAPGQDFLGRYFDRPVAASPGPPLSGRSYLWALRKVAQTHISYERAAALFAQHFQPSALVRETIAAVMAGRNRFDLSIHFRGTDKFLESGRVDVDNLFGQIDRTLPSLPARGQIFLATDDASCEVALRLRYPDVSFTTYNLDDVPTGVPRHFSAMSPQDKALEAVVNIFLIASAPRCIRTSSYLSAISKISRPDLKTVTINKTLSGSTGFPERQVIGTEADG
ncbi:hypothetical protein [Sphingomonas sp. R86520]|uniref:hypothetical protein n=1 Tax=Sphingomonas sp. R86520 TaxID=3093859 RepID=UPI0036D3F04E